jgi:putative transposase
MTMPKIKRDQKAVELAEKIITEYKPKTVADMESALKNIFGPMFESMLQGEMNAHLGYDKHEKGEKNTSNRRNGTTTKRLKTTKGEVEITVPRDREATFAPVTVPKHTRDISAIEDKVLTMYAKGMSQRDIADTITDIYGFDISHETISEITDSVLAHLETWQNRPLKKFYPFAFVDCLYVTLRLSHETKKCAVYVILGYDVDGKKDILGLWLCETESKQKWMHIFDEIKLRGVEDILFLSMDGISGLEEGAKAIFPNVIPQRCIVHLIRHSIKYVPSKDYKVFTASLKLVYGASSLRACESAFETFKNEFSRYPGAIGVWERNFEHVRQLFDYGSDIRRIIYTTNAIEAVNSSFRKVTKQGAFPHENALFKLLYLRVTELEKKWRNRSIVKWALVRNQLDVDPKFQALFRKHFF